MPTEPSMARLTLFSVNDVYQLRPIGLVKQGGLAELATMLSSQRALVQGASQPGREADELLIVAGDFLSASYLATVFKGAHMIAALNALKVDLVTLGNHEFDYGPGVLRERMAESTFTWLCANVLDKQTKKPWNGTIPRMIKQVGGFKVGLFGLCTESSVETSFPGPDIHFRSSVKCAREQVDALLEQGVDAIVAVTHLSMHADRAVARACPEINVILGGHDHHVTHVEEGTTLIFKFGQNALWLGHVTLDLDRVSDGSVHCSVSWSGVRNVGFAPDPDVSAALTKFENELEERGKEIVAKTASSLDGRTTYARYQECTLGNLIADCFVWACESKVDLGIINGGGIRGDRLYPAGFSLTMFCVLQEMPFPNVLGAGVITGQHLRHGLEQMLRHATERSPMFPHLSKGWSLTFDASRPAMERITSLKWNGAMVRDDQEIRLAIPKYLLDGGDGITSFRHARQVNDLRGCGAPLWQVLRDYLIDCKVVSAKLEGRMVRASD